jgi:hypothetical protein
LQGQEEHRDYSFLIADFRKNKYDVPRFKNMATTQDSNRADNFDPDAIIKRIDTSKAMPLGSLNPFIRFLSNIIISIRYNNKRHIPCNQFIRGLESKWGRPIDPTSVFWFRHHDVAVDLLHQILNGQLSTGIPEIDKDVLFVFIDGMFWYTPGLSKEVLYSKDAFGNILDAFSKYYPDAATVIMCTEKAYWKIDG